MRKPYKNVSWPSVPLKWAVVNSKKKNGSHIRLYVVDAVGAARNRIQYFNLVVCCYGNSAQKVPRLLP
jgi:hypothetical protein